MIDAGKVDDIYWSNGTWLILDIGFSDRMSSVEKGTFLATGKRLVWNCGY